MSGVRMQSSEWSWFRSAQGKYPLGLPITRTRFTKHLRLLFSFSAAESKSQRAQLPCQVHCLLALQPSGNSQPEFPWVYNGDTENYFLGSLPSFSEWDTQSTQRGAVFPRYSLFVLLGVGPQDNTEVSDNRKTSLVRANAKVRAQSGRAGLSFRRPQSLPWVTGFSQASPLPPATLVPRSLTLPRPSGFVPVS